MKTKETGSKESTGLNLDFSTSPVVWKFLQSNNFVRGLMGPVGSGKSYACAAEIMMRELTEEGFEVEEVREFCLNLGLSKYKLPKKLYFVDAMPINTNGKVSRELVRKLMLS
jgi:acyl-CoA synthetase (AMP-forming)/AMP-acid ligase II